MMLPSQRKLPAKLRGIAVIAAAATTGVIGWSPSLASAATVDAKAGEKAFVTQADSICRDSNRRLADAAKEFERHDLLARNYAKSKRLKVAKPNDVAEFVTKFGLKELRSQFDQLALLKPPATQSEAFEKALTEARAVLKQIEAKPTDAALRNPFLGVGKQLKKLGFQECGQASKTANGSN